MRFSLPLLLIAALFCAGCDRGGRKGRKNSDSTGDVAVGKLTITPPLLVTVKGSAGDANEAFIEQQLDILRGPEVRKLAEAGVQKNLPEIKPAEVTVTVARTKGSNVVSVIGRGASREYRNALVDSIMDAYISFILPKEPEKAAAAVADSDAAEKNLREAERAWTSFRLENDVDRLNTALSTAERRLQRFGVAKKYYEEELDFGTRLPLEQDIQRRQASPALPQDMPAELAVLVRTTLTVGELACLSALKQTNAAATEAARKEAAKDRDERATSLRKQLEIATELATTAQAEISRLQTTQKNAALLREKLQAAEAAYRDKKQQEKNMGAGVNDSVHPVVSITERASPVKSR